MHVIVHNILSLKRAEAVPQGAEGFDSPNGQVRFLLVHGAKLCNIRACKGFDRGLKVSISSGRSPVKNRQLKLNANNEFAMVA